MMKPTVFLFITACALLSQAAHARINRLAEVAPGIYRGSQPETESDYDLLKSLHIRTILNLRTEKKIIARERKSAKMRGMDLLSVPLSAVTIPNDDSVDQAIVALENSDLKPIFIHCQLGRDRTGLIVGLYRVFQEKWAAKRAFREMLKFGFNPALAGLNYYFWKRTSP
jgi:protein tyrosine/serine phosphatase